MAYSTTNDNNFQVDPDTGEVLHVCPCCGQSLPADFPHEVLTTVDIFNVESYYDDTFDDQPIFDNYLLDVLRLQMTSASFKIVSFLILHTKGPHNHPRAKRFTYQDISQGTGIDSTGTIWQALTELEEMELIGHETDHFMGNVYFLNTERERPGEPQLFAHNAGNGYTRIHSELIRQIMPIVTPAAWGMLVYLIRKTIGWGKDADCISMSQFGQGSGLKDRRYIRANLDRLNNIRLIDADGVVNDLPDIWQEVASTRSGKVYQLNQDFYLSVESRGNRAPSLAETAPPVSRKPRPQSRGNRAPSLAETAPHKTESLNNSLNNSLNDMKQQHDDPPKNEPCEPVDVLQHEEEKGETDKAKREILKELGITWEASIKKIINRAENNLERLRVALDHKALHSDAGPGLYVKWLNGEIDLKWRHEDADGPPPELAPVNGSNGHGQGPGLSPGFYKAIGLCPEWEAAKAILKNRMGGATFSLLQDADCEILGDTMVIKSYRADFIENRLGEMIAQAVATACGRQISLEFQVLGVECHE